MSASTEVGGVDTLDAEEISARGWRQGSIINATELTPESLQPAFPSALEDDLLIVISQDCDVVQRSFEKEPFVEFVLARAIDQDDGRRTHGKNPRSLDLVIRGGVYRISIHEKCRADRRFLVRLTPGGDVDAATLRLLRRWVAQRYQRAPFPDAFNDRISRRHKAVQKMLQARGAELTGIYLDMTDEELDNESNYSVRVLGTMRSEDHAEPEKRIQCQELLGDIAGQLAECQGIDIEDDDLRSEDDVSLTDIAIFKRWDVEYISFRGGVDGNIAPDY